MSYRLGGGLLALLSTFFLVGNAGAASIYFGEDSNPGGTIPAGGNAETARNNFLNDLAVSVQTENFEDFLVGESGPLTLNFDDGGVNSFEATISGVGEIDDSCCGRFPTSGTKLWEASGQFEIVFSEAVAGFGFYGTDIGDFNGQVTVELMGGGTDTYIIDNTINGPDGALLFWGIIDIDNTFTKVTFDNTAPGSDFFGFDDLTVATVAQVVPVPAAVWLLASALAALGWTGRRKRVIESNI